MEVKESQAQRLKKIRHRMLYLAGIQYFAIFATSILMVVQGFKAHLASENDNMVGVGPLVSGLILIVRFTVTRNSKVTNYLLFSLKI